MKTRDIRLDLGIALEDAAMKRKLTRDDLGRLLDERADLFVRFGGDLAAALASLNGQILVTVGDRRSSEQLLAAGRFDYCNDQIVQLWLKRSKRPAGTIKVEPVEFSGNWTFEEGLAELQRRGLKRLEWDDLPLICEQQPDLQRTKWMVSSAVPVDDGVLCAYGHPAYRRLSLGGVRSPWSRKYVLLGVRE